MASGSRRSAATTPARVAFREPAVAGVEHQSLHPRPALGEAQRWGQEGRIVAAGRGIEEMHRGDLALAPLQGGEPPGGADPDRAGPDAALGQASDDGIEPDAVASDDGEVGGAGARADPREAHRLAGLQPGPRGGNREEAVGLREGRHRAGPLGQRNGDRSVPPMGEGGHHEFHAPEFGGDAPGQHSFDALFLARGKPGQRADQGHDEFVEGEYRRGREAGQDDDGPCLEPWRGRGACRA